MVGDPEGRTVLAWRVAGYRFRIVKLRVKRRVGAGDRRYRLYCDGVPALGGQWHYTLEEALARAEYLTICRYSTRIQYLEQQVSTLRNQLAAA